MIYWSKLSWNVIFDCYEVLYRIPIKKIQSVKITDKNYKTIPDSSYDLLQRTTSYGFGDDIIAKI